MTTSFITTNTIGAGAQFTFTAAGNALVVLPNVTLGSTSGSVINFAGFSDVEIAVLGTLVSSAQVTMLADSSFTVGAGATFVSFEVASLNAGLFASFANSLVQIDGTLSAPEAIGILSMRGGNTVNVIDPILPSAAADSTVLPTPVVVTKPEADTVAMLGFADDHATVRNSSRPVDSIDVALNCDV